MSRLTLNRRKFLEFLGSSTALAIQPGWALAKSGVKARSGKPAGIYPLKAGAEDRIRVAEGFEYYLLAEWKDALNAAGDTFGINNDFVAFMPVSANPLADGGYLLVNHESPDPLLLSGGSSPEQKNLKDIDAERYAVGCTVWRVRHEKKSGRWVCDKSDAHNKRINGATPIPFAGGAKVLGKSVAEGTMANCSGGQTPWGTFLTCEENFDDYYGEDSQTPRSKRGSVYGWERFYDNPPEHYGWVVEIHPTSGMMQKLVSLGRFAHEGALVLQAKDQRCVVYMGDDAADQCVYKFVAKHPGSLVEGTLYVGDFAKGRWIALDRASHKKLAAKYSDQTDLLVHARDAAKLVGGTPLDRPEGIAKNPHTGEIVVSLTNNIDRGNYYGSLLSFSEKNNDPLSLEFTSKTLLVAGKELGFACPDNICFDQNGGLWITTDISGKVINKGPYAGLGNNGLFYVPCSGPQAGQVLRIATAPMGAEFTGPCIMPDRETLLLCVQHPGEGSLSLDTLTSHWPEGKKSLPRSSVIAISGQQMRKLFS